MRQGHISKQGDPWLRWIMNQAAQTDGPAHRPYAAVSYDMADSAAATNGQDSTGWYFDDTGYRCRVVVRNHNDQETCNADRSV